jgi:large conductance mechanosensitive channel
MARARRNGFLRDFQDFALKPLIDPILRVFGNDWRNLNVGATKFDPTTKVPLDGIRFGLLLGSIVDFAIIAFVLFLAIQAIQKFKRKEEIEAAEEAAITPDANILAQERLTGAIERLTETIESR